MVFNTTFQQYFSYIMVVSFIVEETTIEPDASH